MEGIQLGGNVKFEKQNYTQTPNSLFAIIKDMDECELKVVLLICRYTFGYHREEVKLSTRRIADEIGMSIVSVAKGAERAVERGLIEKITDGNKTTLWRALVDDSENESQVIQKMNRGVSKNESQLGVKENLNKQKEKLSAGKPRTPPPPEVKLFREVTERYPQKVNFESVTNIIQGVSKRLGRDCTVDDLRPFYAAWCANGWKPTNLAWLSYAERGELPTKQIARPQPSEPKNFDAIRQWLQSKQEVASV